MKLLFQILFFFFCAQSSSAQNKLDSINRLINNATSDTQRINLTVEKIHLLENSDLDAAIILGNKTIEEAKTIGYKKGEADTRMMLSFGYCFKGDYATAKENLDAAGILLSQVKDSASLAKMYDNYGIMYSMQAKYDTAHIFYQKAIAIAQLQPDKALVSTICINIAIAYQQQSNYPQALAYYQKALTVSEQINDLEGEAYLHLNMAITFTLLDDTTRAVQSFFTAVNLAKKLNLKVVEAYAYANLAGLYGDMNKFNESMILELKLPR